MSESKIDKIIRQLEELDSSLALQYISKEYYQTEKMWLNRELCEAYRDSGIVPARDYYQDGRTY